MCVLYVYEHVNVYMCVCVGLYMCVIVDKRSSDWRGVLEESRGMQLKNLLPFIKKVNSTYLVVQVAKLCTFQYIEM